ncbi:hypothetical protein OVY01_14870 [Robbsia sp. Bb-Pol-6]|uniref:Uncharacterized protein n=1 Tax=Robbsia betulipollinis TaxID=2981849 RepID=A0ABT3ZRA1_9BURK|nr:hypothetical protein [Robbsia betulipollinis]MCY0388475.1 hypothetical protein [Robbsia betulipollinis]
MRFVILIARRLAPLLVCPVIYVCAAFSAAQAQTPAIQARIEAPGDAPLVRLRWPATSLARAATGRLVALDDAAGTPLSFGFVVAPEDQGHTVRPMWLIVRLQGAVPYRLSVSRDGLSGRYRDDPDALSGHRLPPLGELPVATVPADAWGPIVAVLEDAQAAQQSTDTRWRRWILALAVSGLIALAALIAFFARGQARRDDVTRL